MGVFCEKFNLGSTAALYCQTGFKKGRYCKKELLLLLVSLIAPIHLKKECFFTQLIRFLSDLTHGQTLVTKVIKCNFHSASKIGIQSHKCSNSIQEFLNGFNPCNRPPTHRYLFIQQFFFLRSNKIAEVPCESL